MFWKRKSVTSPSWVNHSWYSIEAVFKCLLLDIGSESVQFDNGSIYVQFCVTFIMFSAIFFYSLIWGFSVTDEWMSSTGKKEHVRFLFILQNLFFKVIKDVFFQFFSIFRLWWFFLYVDVVLDGAVVVLRIFHFSYACGQFWPMRGSETKWTKSACMTKVICRWPLSQGFLSRKVSKKFILKR